MLVGFVLIALVATDGGSPPKSLASSSSQGPGSLGGTRDGTPSISSLRKEEIRRVIGENRTAVRHCYEAAPRAELPHKVVLDFTVLADGSVEIQSVDSDDNEQRRACLTAVLSGLKFPPSKSGSAVPVSYPFTFCYKGSPLAGTQKSGTVP